MTEEKHLLIWSNLCELVPDFVHVLGPEFFPFAPFLNRRVWLINGQSNQRRNHTNQHVSANLKFPQARNVQVLPHGSPTRETHSSMSAHKTLLAQFVITNGQPQPVSKSRSQFSHALFCAFARRLIA